MVVVSLRVLTPSNIHILPIFYEPGKQTLCNKNNQEQQTERWKRYQFLPSEEIIQEAEHMPLGPTKRTITQLHIT